MSTEGAIERISRSDDLATRCILTECINFSIIPILMCRQRVHSLFHRPQPQMQEWTPNTLWLRSESIHLPTTSELSMFLDRYSDSDDRQRQDEQEHQPFPPIMRTQISLVLVLSGLSSFFGETGQVVDRSTSSFGSRLVGLGHVVDVSIGRRLSCFKTFVSLILRGTLLEQSPVDATLVSPYRRADIASFVLRALVLLLVVLATFTLCIDFEEVCE